MRVMLITWAVDITTVAATKPAGITIKGVLTATGIITVGVITTVVVMNTTGTAIMIVIGIITIEKCR
jgi:hypothetical protein